MYTPQLETNRVSTVSGSAIPLLSDGTTALKLFCLTGEEGLSKSYRYRLDLITSQDMLKADTANVDLLSVLERELTVYIQLEGVQVTLPDDRISNIIPEMREISGIVTEASLAEQHNTHCIYRFVIEPWLVLTKKNSDYRIFQKKTVIEIINEVLGGNYGYPFIIKLNKTYPIIEYEVQYGETDYDFIQRLMEKYGIYWFFEHRDNTHWMILVDDINIHQPVKNKTYQVLPYARSEDRKEREYIDQFEVTERIHSGHWQTDDFDFTKPKIALKAINSVTQKKSYDKLSIYEWPGNYTEIHQGVEFSRVRIEELFAQSKSHPGAGNIRNIVCGTVFELKNHPMKAANQKYLVTRSYLELREIGEESHTGECSIVANFDVQPVSIAYRPVRLTPYPKTTGPQTAIVTGPPGQEIWTDQYGRVKLKFHWDHSSVCDHNSSCWIRVSYPWAGGNFGGINIPRIGQEVIVDFENGNPNYPIITGRVYNAGTMPPWGLPMNATQSGMVSRSIGGLIGNSNALRFEDKAGTEEIWLQAERDMLSEIKNNEVHNVGANRIRTVCGNELIKLLANRTRSVEQNDTLEVGQDQKTTVKGNQQYEVQKNHDRQVGGDDSLNIDGNQKISIGQSQQIQIQQDLSESINGNYTGQIGQTYSLTAQDKIELTVGSSSLVMESSGKITLNGADILVSSSGPFKLNASGNIDIQSSGEVKINGNTIDLN